MESPPRERRRLDPEGTRRAILAAATRCFSRGGYSGTAMGDIAKAAGVTKSLVQYHFETKERLWQAALSAGLAPFLEAVERFLQSPRRREDMIILLRERYRVFAESPETIRLVGWASMESAPLPDSARNKAPQIWSEITGNEIERRRRMLVALSAIDGWMLLRGLYSRITGQDLNLPELSRHVLDCIEQSLLPPEGNYEAKS